MCSDFWFNSESVLTDARLTRRTECHLHSPALGGLVGYMLTHPTKSNPPRCGNAWRWLVRCSTHQGATRQEMGARGCALFNKVKKKRKWEKKDCK